MKECESLRNEKRIRKDESNRKEFLDLQTKFNALQEEKQEQEDKYQKLKSQNTFLVDKNNKLQKQNSDYQYSIIELESEVQELKNNCLALEDENQDKADCSREDGNGVFSVDGEVVDNLKERSAALEDKRKRR